VFKVPLALELLVQRVFKVLQVQLAFKVQLVSKVQQVPELPVPQVFKVLQAPLAPLVL
jgi:hypothetical protein